MDLHLLDSNFAEILFVYLLKINKNTIVHFFMEKKV